MRISSAGTKACLLGSALIVCSPFLAGTAQASSNDAYGPGQPTRQTSFRASGVSRVSTAHAATRPARDTRAPAEPVAISCVPYAREVSGIMVVGNAWQWWSNASGQYARGDRPEPGSVLTFRANSRMRLGHVAVVRRVVNAREVIVDHANWASAAMRGPISHNVTVVDVSEANNWSAVRVQMYRSGDFGSIYPTYGFIYNRPDNGIIVAKIDRPAPQPQINQVPSDLRPAAERPWHTFEEVAESPEGQSRRFVVLSPATSANR